MAYLIFTANGEEYDRRELRAPITLGRAPDCDLSIPDIILSRRHCRVEPTENGKGWQVVDLHSKNGTQFRGQNIECHVLRDGDEVRIGRTRLTFKAGKYVANPAGSRPRAVVRAADPHEALAGTVTGMVLCEPGETEKHEGMPVPQPRPMDPDAFADEDVYGLINEIASSSWDSTYAQNSKPVRMQRATPVPGVTKAHAPASRPRPRVSFALQAEHSESAIFAAPLPPPEEPAPIAPPPLAAQRVRRRRRSLWVAASLLIAAGVSVATWAVLTATPGVRTTDKPSLSAAGASAVEASSRQGPDGVAPMAHFTSDPESPGATVAPAVTRADRSARDAETPAVTPAPTTRPRQAAAFALPRFPARAIAPSKKFDLGVDIGLAPDPINAATIRQAKPTDIVPDDLFNRSPAGLAPARRADSFLNP